MKKVPRLAIVLAGWERATFLPPDLEQQLSDLTDDLVLLDPDSLEGEDAWTSWLEATGPDVLVSCWMTPKLPENLGQRVPQLKYVCHLAGAVKDLVPDSLIEDGLLVTNWGHAVSRTIAESGLMMAIAALRRVSHWAHEMHHEGGWKEGTSVVTGSLFERTVGLHGFGAISQELAKLLQPFQVEISTYSPSVPDNLLEEFGVRRVQTLEELFSQNDVIIELAALTPKNTGIVTEALLRSIPAGGAFVNVGRGAVVDEAALARVAQDGHIQVALDVYTSEPLPKDSPLRGMTNVLLLPHLGGPTADRRRDSTKLGIANIKRYLCGESFEAEITSSIYKRIT